MIARLLLMGLRRSGKSSIQKVVFQRMAPNDTVHPLQNILSLLFLESTARVQKDDIHAFVRFALWDFPGQIDFFSDEFDTDMVNLGVIWVMSRSLEGVGRWCS
jgi:Ras-related GTP-binding protein C/D